MKQNGEKKTNVKKELKSLLIAVLGSFAVFAGILCIIARDDIKNFGTFDGVKEVVDDIPPVVPVVGNTDPVTTVAPLYYYDESMISDEYLVGMDYFTGDFLEYAPTVIVKVRYDGRIEVGFDHTLLNGEE